MTRIAILGAGYIGGKLIVPLKKRGLTVRVSTTTPSKANDLETIADEVFLLKGNEKNKTELFLKDCDGLILTVAPKESGDYQATYLETAETIRDTKPKLKYLLYTSSTSVYGNYHGNLVDEETKPMPESQQGEILLNTESTYLKSLLDETKVCILRLGGIYGPGREVLNRVKKFAGRKIPGNGSSITNLIHCDDIVSAILWSLDQELVGVHNLVNDTHVTRKELYMKLAQQNKLPEVLWDNTGVNPHAGNKIVSNEKIKSTGFRFIHSTFEENRLKITN